MKTILLTGSKGQVGGELKHILSSLGDVVACDRHLLDLSKPQAIRSFVREVKPHAIINAAAYTHVDQSEKEPDLAMKINAEAPKVLAEEAFSLKSLFIHYSSDYVFNGQSNVPYHENDEAHPLNVYGRSKLAGEQAIEAIGGKRLILRTSWVYGTQGHNFLLTVLRLAKERDTLKIVDDQIGAPTWSRHIAEATFQLLSSFFQKEEALEGEKWGLYHLSSSGQTSWYGFARQIFLLLNKGGFSEERMKKIPHIKPIPSKEYPTPALRPSYSVLSNEKIINTFDIKMPSWENGLEHCLNELRESS